MYIYLRPMYFVNQQLYGIYTMYSYLIIEIEQNMIFLNACLLPIEIRTCELSIYI